MSRERTPQAVVQRFVRTLHRLELTSRRVAIAFSAGPDSTALAICCAEAKRAVHLDPVLIHIDHNIRATSASEAEQAVHIANSLGLPIESAALTHRAEASEATLREDRYSFLHHLSNQAGADVLFTGHHADDQAETLLLNLVRGTGIKGARAMREARSLGLDGPVGGIVLVRPLLFERRADLHALVKAAGIEPVTDDSNTDTAFRRNLIRHQVLPLLEETSPGATERLAHFSSLLADDARFLDGLAATTLGLDAYATSLLLEPLRIQPVPLRSRMVRAWVHEQTGILLSFERTVAIDDLAMHGSGGSTIQLGDHWAVTRVGPALKIHQRIEVNDGGLLES